MMFVPRPREHLHANHVACRDLTAVTEFWVSDDKGRAVFANVKGIDFSFPTGPKAGTQATPFAALLDDSMTMVLQDARPREYVSQPRIVQIGISASDNGKR